VLFANTQAAQGRMRSSAKENMGEDRYAPPWLKLSRAQVIKIAALTVLVTAAVAALAAYLVTGKSQVRLSCTS
jgi:hypothetical protein